MNSSKGCTDPYLFDTYYRTIKSVIYCDETKRLSAPVEVYLELTNACNLRCEYCYKKRLGYSEKELSFESIKRVIRQLTDKGPLLVVLEGGEPLLYEEITELLQWLYKEEIFTEIITNGIFITKELMASIIQPISKEMLQFQVSLDGVGFFNQVNRGIESKRVFDGIKQLNESGVFPRVNSVITRNNYKGLAMLMEKLETDVKIEALSVNPVRGISNMNLRLSKEEEVYVREVIEKERNHLSYEIQDGIIEEYQCNKSMELLEEPFFRCTAMRSKICIAANGDVYPCVFLENRITPIGNIYMQDIDSIWNSEAANQFVQDNIERNKQCIRCVNNKTCRQHCAGDRL